MDEQWIEAEINARARIYMLALKTLAAQLKRIQESSKLSSHIKINRK